MDLRLGWVAAALGMAAAVMGCGDDGSPAGTDAGAVDDGGADAGPSYTRVSEAQASAMRDSCGFDQGAMPWETVGEEYPIGGDIPIDHIVLLMQENRSFDHYFGTMPGVEGIPAGASNPDAMGNPVAPFHTTEYCIDDVHHGWDPSHIQYGDGDNDGFVLTNDPGGERALGYFTDADIPFYWDLYGTFAMSDHHHCSVLGPTLVNRLYSISGSSFGLIRNVPVPPDRVATRSPAHLFDELDAAGIDWAIYAGDLAVALGMFPLYLLNQSGRIRTHDDFFAAVAAGTLPPVSLVDPTFLGAAMQQSEHPPGDPQVGQHLVWQVVDALTKGPEWSTTALIVTYDEHGGFYDHVPPPAACPPGDFPPDIGDGGDFDAKFDRLGFRVPLVVVSPYAKAGYVSDRVTDLTSVLRFVQTRFLLPALTARDANAWPLLDMFDFDAPPFMDPPSFDEPTVDQAILDDCIMRYPDSGSVL